jgi:glycosyltransferase involved in cell wall biosynthesis
MLTGDVKWGALRATDAFVLPSHTENFGVGIVEALAAGRPVLISDKVNISSDIQADGVGLVETDTAAGTERLLQRWIAMPREQREAMAGRAHASFVNRYSMERAASAIIALFTDSEQGKADESTS